MITQLEELRSRPLAGGADFGAAGGYLCVTGIACGQIDPESPANQRLPEIQFAPRDRSGKVAYRTPFMALRPQHDRSAGGSLVYEVTNRGKKLAFAYLFGAAEPCTTFDDIRHLGGALPLKMGCAFLWSGWDATAPTEPGSLALDAPVLVENGAPMVRPVREEFVSETRHGPLAGFRLAHEPMSRDPSQVTVSVRTGSGGLRRDLSPGEWRFSDHRTVILLPEGRRPEPGIPYEVRYLATGARWLGAGYAAVRDLVSFLRRDEAGLQVIGPVAHASALGISQSGRFLRGYLRRGLNRDEGGRRVFDGVFSHVAGAGRVFMDEVFGQPTRTRTRHQDHDFPEADFPFADAVMDDPWSGVRAGVLSDPDCDPRLIQTNTPTEYWQKGASLVHTDPLATRDLAIPQGSRVYLIAGTQHDARPGTSGARGPCGNPCNPHDPSPVLRALFVALLEWISGGREPPASCIPTLAAGTLVSPQSLRFPHWSGLIVPIGGNDVRPIEDWVVPRLAAFEYPTLVCAVDADGNEVDGVRTPDICVPLGTYAGWNCYRAPWPSGVLADRYGSFVPFSTTSDERCNSGDPRLSLSERYTNAGYRDAVAAAARDLRNRRLLLAEDAEEYLRRARSTALPGVRS